MRSRCFGIGNVVGWVVWGCIGWLVEYIAKVNVVGLRLRLRGGVGKEIGELVEAGKLRRRFLLMLILMLVLVLVLVLVSLVKSNRETIMRNSVEIQAMPMSMVFMSSFIMALIQIDRRSAQWINKFILMFRSFIKIKNIESFLLFDFVFASTIFSQAKGLEVEPSTRNCFKSILILDIFKIESIEIVISLSFCFEVFQVSNWI